MNDDMDAREVAALEERLYSQCHHSYEVTTSSEGTSLPMADNVPLRIVSKTSVVNNPQSAQLKSKMKRYWATKEGYSASQKSDLQQTNTYQKQSAPSEPTRTNGNGSTAVQSNANEPKKMFTMPYQSLLGYSQQNSKDHRTTLPAETVSKVTNKASNLRKAQGSAKPNPPRKLQKKLQPKKNPKPSKLAVQKKLAGLIKLVNRDASESRKQRLQAKKAKAFGVRKFSAPRVVAQLFLYSSDDEPKPTVVVPHEKGNIDAQSDGEADEVVIIPLPEPPKICIDCSDDEVALDSFAFPQAKKTSKKATVTKINSPRGLSPSNSSIMSDDFIGLHERSRLNDSFIVNVPNDDELECSIEGKRGGDVQKGTKSYLPSRDQRAPSISSEETVCTSSDTTDQDKHRQESGRGNKSQTLPTSRNESIAAGENGKKDELSNKKGSSQATGTKQLIDHTPLAKTTEQSILSAPSGTAKKGSTKKATPSVQASGPGVSHSSAKCKSPISIALELARKHFEGNDSSRTEIGSAKKKSKKGRASDANQSSVTQDLIPTKHSVAKKSVKARKKVGTDVDSRYKLIGDSTAKKRVERLPLSDDSVSSESDYELTIVTHQDGSQGTGEQITSTSLPNEASSKQPSVGALTGLDVFENISSESEYEESFSQALKSTPKTAFAKRVGRKRKQYNSETFSDEDFACMLTDIVRAVSDTDDDDEEEELKERLERQEKESNHAKEAPDDAVTSTTVIAELDCGEQEKQTKVPKPSAKQKKRSANASKAVSTSIVSASKPNDKGPTVEKCLNAASSTTANAEPRCERQGNQTKAGCTKKKKRSLDASNAASSSIVYVAGNLGDGGYNTENSAVAANSSTAVDVAEQTDGPSTKKKRQSNDSSSGNIASIVDRNEDVRSEQLDSAANKGDAPTTRSQIVQEASDCAWNEEMKRFYNDVWMDDGFNLSSVMKKMPRGKKHWPILQQDLYPYRPKPGVICINCGDRGHLRNKCKNTKPAVCYMCGEKGHREPRCPRSICLNCGTERRNFVRGCYACAWQMNITCRLCGVRGHLKQNCPDMWRRYHSTTNDNVPLRTDYRTNVKAKYCCICCKSDHQADNCKEAYRIFGQAVPITQIQSYERTYRHNQKCSKVPTSVPRYNLFSEDANECVLNLHELASNPNGFYYRFAKSSGMLEKYEQRRNQEEETRQQWGQQWQLQERQQQQRKEEEHQQQQQREQGVDMDENRPQNVAESSREENTEPVACPVETEDSNYSFSGLLAEKERVDRESVTEAANKPSAAKDNEPESQIKSVAKATEAWPDFIPLDAEPEAPPLPEELQPKDNVLDTMNVTEEKIPLGELQAKILRASDGSAFLNEAAKRHSLKLSISLNALLMDGRADSQECFHQELVHFLKRGESMAANEKLLASEPIPFTMRSAFIFIFEKLWRLQYSHEDVHALFTNYQKALQFNCRGRVIRFRTKLNVVLFGYFGLRDGRKHLNTLRNQLLETVKCNTRKDTLLKSERDAIRHAFVYIFSEYDHMDYHQVVSEYDEMCRTKQLQKFLWSDLRLPLLENNSQAMQLLRRVKNRMYKEFIDRQEKEIVAAESRIAEKSHCKNKHSSSPTMPSQRRCSGNRSSTHYQQEDRVLNTRDQMINSKPRQHFKTAIRDYQLQQQTIRAKTVPFGAVKPQHSSTKSRGIRNYQFNGVSLNNVLADCRLLAKYVHPNMRACAYKVMRGLEKAAMSNPGINICVLISEAHSLRAMLRKNQSNPY